MGIQIWDSNRHSSWRGEKVSLLLYRNFLAFASFSFKVYLFIFRERGWEGERKGEKHWCKRETHITCPSYAPQLRTKPAPQTCALTGNGTGDLLVCRTLLHCHSAQGLHWLYHGQRFALPILSFSVNFTEIIRMMAKSISFQSFETHSSIMGLLFKSSVLFFFSCPWFLFTLFCSKAHNELLRAILLFEKN